MVCNTSLLECTSFHDSSFFEGAGRWSAAPPSGEVRKARRPFLMPLTSSTFDGCQTRCGILPRVKTSRRGALTDNTIETRARGGGGGGGREEGGYGGLKVQFLSSPKFLGFSPSFISPHKKLGGERRNWVRSAEIWVRREESG